MKKLLLFLLFPFALHAQSIPIGLVALSTLTDLRTQQPQINEIVQLMGLTSVLDGNGGNYVWVPASTVADDGFVNIQVTGITTGRWQRVLNNNTIKGNASITPVLLQTAYNISFGQTLPIVPVDIQVQATSSNGALLNWVTNKSTTGFTINFVSVPIGTATFDYIVFKQ